MHVFLPIFGHFFGCFGFLDVGVIRRVLQITRMVTCAFVSCRGALGGAVLGGDRNPAHPVVAVWTGRWAAMREHSPEGVLQECSAPAPVPHVLCVLHGEMCRAFFLLLVLGRCRVYGAGGDEGSSSVCDVSFS